jgi:hypothetical protein
MSQQNDLAQHINDLRLAKQELDYHKSRIITLELKVSDLEFKLIEMRAIINSNNGVNNDP